MNVKTLVAKAEGIPEDRFKLLINGAPYSIHKASQGTQLQALRLQMIGKGGSSKRPRVDEEDKRTLEIQEKWRPETLQKITAINNSGSRQLTKEEKLKDYEGFDSPGIFIGCVDENDCGHSLLKNTPNSLRVPDLVEIQKRFPLYGHVSLGKWGPRQSPRRGLFIRFASWEHARFAYEDCIRNCVRDKITFCYLRGNKMKGGIPAPLHPGKLEIDHVYAMSEQGAEAFVRDKLHTLFNSDSLSPYGFRRFFEDYIDVQLISKNVGEHRKWTSYKVYVYLTETALLTRVVEAFEGKKSTEVAPSMTVKGHHLKRCDKCQRRDHTTSQHIDTCLRITTADERRQVAPTLMKLLKEGTGAKEVITGSNNYGPCKSWGYIRFEKPDDLERPMVLEFIKKMVQEGKISSNVLLCPHGPRKECWYCGETGHNSKNCHLRRTRSQIANSILHVDSKAKSELLVSGSSHSTSTSSASSSSSSSSSSPSWPSSHTSVQSSFPSHLIHNNPYSALQHDPDTDSEMKTESKEFNENSETKVHFNSSNHIQASPADSIINTNQTVTTQTHAKASKSPKQGSPKLGHNRQSPPSQPSSGQILRPTSKDTHAHPRPSVSFASSNPCFNKPPAGRGAWTKVAITLPQISQLDTRISVQSPSSPSSDITSPPKVENISVNHQFSTNLTTVHKGESSSGSHALN